MREIDDIQATSGLPHRGWLLLAAFLLIGLVVVLGRWVFPQEVIKLVTVEKEKRVEVPVERIVEKRVEVPVERIVEKRVEVPVEKIVYRDRPAAAVAPAPQGWAGLQEGLNEEQVRALLGNPLKVMTSGYTAWEYPNFGHVMFYNGRLIRWSEPTR